MTPELEPMAASEHVAGGDHRRRHGEILQAMLDRLSGADLPALAELTTRDPGDPSIALLDAAAYAADVVEFYHERFRDEGYLATAIDRRSVVELAGLVGYAPRPGVASSTYLAFTMEDGHDAELAAGTPAQSVPGPGQLPQTFETSERIAARAAFNELLPQTRRPQIITLGDALRVEELVLSGSATRLNPGDLVLLYFGEGDGRQVVRAVNAVSLAADATRTTVALDGIHPALQQLFDELKKVAANAVLERARRRLLDSLALGGTPDELWSTVQDDPDFDPWVALVKAALVPEPEKRVDRPPVTLDQVVGGLGGKPIGRVAPLGREIAGDQDQVIRAMAALGRLSIDRLGAVWQSRAGGRTHLDDELQGLFALRRTMALFGGNAPLEPVQGGGFREWTVSVNDEAPGRLYLDAIAPDVFAGSHVVIHRPDSNSDDPRRSSRIHRIVNAAATASRFAYGIGGRTTRVGVADWWQPKDQDDNLTMPVIRGTTVYCASERLELDEVADSTPIGCSDGDGWSPSTIVLDRLIAGLSAGRTVVVSGRQATDSDVDHPAPADATGIPVAEVSTILDVVVREEPKLASVVILDRPLRECYRRDTVRILGNVAGATQGETRTETLGSGDPQVAHRQFGLKQGPLTYVPVDTPAGAASTLEVRVDALRWTELTPGDEPAADARVYRATVAEDGKPIVEFGAGARPRTGPANIEGTYRVGIGPGGNLDPGVISTLVIRPLGLKSVVNPIPATGAAGPDDRDAVRERAPIATHALGRLIGVSDYADFALAYAGIAKADARRLLIAGRDTVHVTIAGVDDAPLGPDTEALGRLRRALVASGDPILPIEVGERSLILLVLAARIRIDRDRRWVDVEAVVRRRLLGRFGFRARSLRADALLSDAIATIQACPGVDYVDVDAWGGISVPEEPGSLQDAIGRQLAEILAPGPDKPPSRIVVPPARVNRDGLVQPAGLAYLSPDLPGLLTLSEVPNGG